MNSSQLRSFHAVAQAGTFTAAAKMLHITQPAVTTQVKALESHYDVELFHRSHRGCVLTEAGKALFELTAQMQTLDDEAAVLLASASGEIRGTLNIYADGPFHSIGILTEFHRRYPAVSIRLTVGNSHTVERALRRFDADVAVLAGAEFGSDVFTLSCGKQPVALLVPTAHPFAKKDFIELKKLHDHPMIRRETGSRTQEAFDSVCKAHGVNPIYVFEMGSREALKESVASGLGVGAVSLPETGNDSRVRAIEIRGAEIQTQEHVVCLASRRQTRLVRAFLETSAQYHGHVLEL
ncbi:MAG: LysR family transcriptional regulator [Deltaproteobacteria bacterium]|jgi:LysR family transcriptional regulator, low CO2-responsive transcriptional regulator|nr:LysR family transcriptional regulator [Deltaproteobacteria bacterium]MBT6436157.1 LysR family transcriptional regulator [Deltaproteobacteria bacterium]MBT6490524.1 LysR family transcriptional regulator [Deltaproteobacteria bacterium]